MRTRIALPLFVVLAVFGLGSWLRGAGLGVPTGQWLSGSPIGSPRTGAVAVTLDDGRVLLVGGRTSAGPAASVDLVGSDGSVTAVAPLSIPRAGHAAVRLPDGSVLVAGGTTVVATEQGTAEVPTATAELYQAGAWIPVGPLSAARSGLTATALPDGRVLLAGGTGDTGALDSLEVYDPTAGGFHPAGILSAPRAEHAAALAGPTQVLVAGGRNADGVLATADLVDVDSGSVATVALAVPRADGTATALLDGRVLLAGGSDGANDLASLEVVDPVSGTSSLAGALAAPRRDHQAVLLDHNATVLIVGGTSGGAVAPAAEQFIPWTGAVQAASAPAVARAEAAAASGPADGVALVAGGRAADGTQPAATDLYGFATLKTDKDDYAPGQFVTISGSGWQAGEVVTLVLRETGPTPDPDVTLTATADANGNIVNDIWAPDEHDIGMRFYLTATGAGSSAQVTFTDGQIQNNSGVTLAPSSVTVTAGDSASYTVTVQFNNPPGSCTALLSVTTGTGQTGLPAGAGAVFTPASVAHSGAGTESAALNVTTTGGTAGGNYTFTVQAASSTGCSPARTETYAGTLVVVGKTNTTTSITSDLPDPSVVGESVPVHYTVAPTSGSGTPTGNVTVTDGTQSCTATVAAGQCTIAFSSAGPRTLTATYDGDSSFNGSMSAGVSHQVNKANTTTSITSDLPDPSVVGETVTIAFTVSPVAPGSGTPTGNVTVTDGTQSCTATVLAGQCTIAFSSVGAHTLTAEYVGDSNFNGSTSAGEGHNVNKAGTTTSIISDSPDPSVVGEAVTVSYSVTVNSPGAGTPTGSVTVSDGTDSCNDSVGAGSCEITFSSAGVKSLTAEYAGDSNFSGSTSGAESHTVNTRATTTVLTLTPSTVVVGQASTVNVTVTDVESAGTKSNPTGTVTLGSSESSDGFSGSCTLSPSGSNAATCSVTVTPAHVGSSPHSISASFAATAVHSASSDSKDLTVDKADTTTAITSDSPDPSVTGQSVTVQFSVSVSAPGAGTPTGNVTVSDGTSTCTVTVAVGQCSIAFPTAGGRTLTATYAGDSDFNGSTSPGESHQVNKADTTTTITADTPDPSVTGQSVTIQFAVAVTAPGAGTPTGNVTVSDGTLSCSASVAIGECSIAFTTAGPKSLTATYEGDANFNGSVSASASHTVNKADTTTTIESDNPDPSLLNEAYLVTWTVTVNSPGAGTPTGTVMVTDGTDSCSAAVGVGQCSMASTTVGSKTLTATYSGDSNFNGSSDTEGHTVQYKFAGFFAPIENSPAINKAKAGQAIPIKWQLTDGLGNPVADPGSFISVTYSATYCDGGATFDTLVSEDYAGNSGLLYLGGGNWQFNWKTPKTYAKSCGTAMVNLSDGTHMSFNVQFSK